MKSKAPDDDRLNAVCSDDGKTTSPITPIGRDDSSDDGEYGEVKIKQNQGHGKHEESKIISRSVPILEENNNSAQEKQDMD